MYKMLIFFIFFIMPAAFADTQKTLVFATEATYPPHVSMSASGEVVGFDADIVHALCHEMHASCKIINQPWASLMPSLELGKFDAIFGGLSITDAREKQVDFTTPYYKDTGSFIALKKKDIQFSSEGLKNKVIGVQGGTTFDFYLQGIYGAQVTIKRYPSVQNAFIDLKSGRIDAVLGDTPVILGQLQLNKSNNNQYIVSKPVDDSQYLGKGDAIAVNKKNIALLKQLNVALQTIHTNGQYTIIKNKYFP